ncbi:MAG: hypothetical protein NTW60_01350 [Candidatus Wolfebacteria bacterium]|nr:hypothetical protein [Candidatus Wolfebacteria bacterium]
MLIKEIKSVIWTKHARAKMRFYGLSEQRVRRVLNSPKRIEEGIAPDTIAAMQSAGSLKHPHEIWVMFVKVKNAPTPSGGRGPDRSVGSKRIVSAWKYPGKTKPGDPLPQEIINELSLSLMDLD